MISRLRQLPPLFFLGFFPVVILLWAWADSTGFQSQWTYVDEADVTKAVSLEASALIWQSHERDSSFVPVIPPVSSLSGGFTISCSFGPSGILGILDRLCISRHAISGGTAAAGGLFPAPGKTTALVPGNPAWYSRFRDSTITIPLWLILLAWLPVWLALSRWQARRRHAKITAALP